MRWGGGGGGGGAPLYNLLCGTTVLANSNGSKDFEELLKLAHYEASDPVINWTTRKAGISASVGDAVGDTLDAAGATCMLLKPKNTSGKNLRIVDIVDNICQKDHERLVAEHGITRLMINFFICLNWCLYKLVVAI